MFQVGQRVVCIDDQGWPSDVHDLYIALPKKDSVYTVRNVELGINTLTGEEGEICIHLQELRNPLHRGVGGKPGRERGFRCERFAPLEEDTDVVTNSEEDGLYTPAYKEVPSVRELVEV